MPLILNPKNYNLILASQSPRRKQLLADLGYSFTQLSKDLDESFPENMPINKVAEYLACKKADGFKADLKPNDLLITSDTTVCLANEILNKASNEAEAKTMLQKLSGKSHEVITGVCLSSMDKRISFSVSTKVFFKSLSNSEIEYYIQHFKPFDKAGAYGIQEWIGFIGVEKIEGSYFNVMGLPVKELHEAIEQF
ncbi:MAG: septum formation protein Maf [Bacteroidetes bacterium]|nr:MAG: septum formation protein Maf [Bacteroidota bacterium]MBL1145313.1 septum formation protein Maf [Bacteroidota bacterium]NOG58110.1 septum formation protein Maf [Bacteroidota bacterium]